jgi:hypothetical protein
LCDAAKKMACDKTDHDEEIARKMYDQFQRMSVKENFQKFTILIERNVLPSWETVLNVNYGNPKDQKSSGKKFS